MSTGTAGAIAPHQPVTRLASALDQGRSWRCPARRFLRCSQSRWGASCGLLTPLVIRPHPPAWIPSPDGPHKQSAHPTAPCCEIRFLVLHTYPVGIKAYGHERITTRSPPTWPSYHSNHHPQQNLHQGPHPLPHLHSHLRPPQIRSCPPRVLPLPIQPANADILLKQDGVSL